MEGVEGFENVFELHNIAEFAITDTVLLFEKERLLGSTRKTGAIMHV
jgi:hypothetical protein